MNAAIQSLWVGDRLSTMERLCISSFLRHGHPFHLYVYDSVEGIPPGTTVLDARAILPASRIFMYREHKTYAGFANFFRYKLLLEKGGWWVDADTVCVRPFDFPAEYVFSSEGLNGRKTVNVGVVKVPPGSAVMRYAWETCETMDVTELKWSECGPGLVRKAIAFCSLDEHVVAPETFCPVHFSEWEKVLHPAADLKFGAETCAIHLWNELWRRSGCDKDAAYSCECLYERLKRDYLE